MIQILINKLDMAIVMFTMCSTAKHRGIAALHASKQLSVCAIRTQLESFNW